MNHMFLNNALHSNDAKVMEARDVSYLDELLLNADKRLKPVFASELRKVNHIDLIYWCNINGYYSIPSIELMDTLREYLPEDKKLLEIGAGNGVYGRHLNVRMTDNFQQHPKNRARFRNSIASREKAGLGLVPYGDDVEECDARDAISLYKPNVVLAAWVTQKYNPTKPHLKGNMYGVSYQWILNRRHVDSIILIGNKRIHKNIDIMDKPHIELECSGTIFSRAFDEGYDRIFIWNK